MVICNFVIPFVLLAIRRLRSLKTAVISSIAVIIGMWLERFLIVMPTLSHPHLPAAWGGMYDPTWVEIAITAATFAAMAMLYLVFSKLFPIIAIWEYKTEEEH
jgi:molybdopterin-containing oxidoreductase family membrane subunit